MEKQGLVWGEGETKFLLVQYESYVTQVGPRKRFKTKKNMWQEIASDINKKYLINVSCIQVENRYKTLMKRKKMAVDNNKSGSTRMDIPFEEEIAKITMHDDSIEPEVVRSAGCTKVLKGKVSTSMA